MKPASKSALGQKLTWRDLAVRPLGAESGNCMESLVKNGVAVLIPGGHYSHSSSHTRLAFVDRRPSLRARTTKFGVNLA